MSDGADRPVSGAWRLLAAALRRVPFTTALVALMGVVAVVTASHSQPIPHPWLARLGFAPADLRVLELDRLATSAVSTHGGPVFWRAVVAVAAIVGVAEWRTGTARSATLFVLSHLATLLVLAALVGVGLRSWHPPLADLLHTARDVGPSAGYFGCLALVCTTLPRPRRRIAALAVSLALAGALVVTLERAVAPAAISAAMAHVIAFPSGWLLAIAADAIHERRDGT